MSTFIQGVLEGVARQSALEAQRAQAQVVRVQGCRATLSATPDIKIKARK